ncbi:MAG: hypothetical protein MZW92_19515 [Comamonadaceae bacterium]|nr:hypothetical protein [Comamonadaceae bacterium]
MLLFYLMPLWAVLLARLLLHERLTRARRRCAWRWRWPARAIVLLARRRRLAAAAHAGRVAGRARRLQLRAEQRDAAARGAPRREAARALAMFLGGVLVAGALATTLALHGARARGRRRPRPAGSPARPGAGA